MSAQRSAKARERYRTTPEVRERKRRAAASRSPDRRRQHLVTTYGITPEQYDELLAAQGGMCMCAICDATPEQNGKALAVDHCHETGQVRGLLCSPHNQAIGIFGDNLAGVQRAADYLARAEGMTRDALEALRSG